MGPEAGNGLEVCGAAPIEKDSKEGEEGDDVKLLWFTGDVSVELGSL